MEIDSRDALFNNDNPLSENILDGGLLGSVCTRWIMDILQSREGGQKRVRRTELFHFIETLKQLVLQLEWTMLLI